MKSSVDRTAIGARMLQTVCFVKAKYRSGGACSGWCERLTYLHFAGVIQLVECQLPKLDVAGSSPVARSREVLDLEKFWSPESERVPAILSWDPLRDLLVC